MLYDGLWALQVQHALTFSTPHDGYVARAVLADSVSPGKRATRTTGGHIHGKPRKAISSIASKASVGSL